VIDSAYLKHVRYMRKIEGHAIDQFGVNGGAIVWYMLLTLLKLDLIESDSMISYQ
jgi:hypothetical protein